MFYKVKVKDHVRVPPNLFGEKLPDAVLKMIKKHYNGYISQELGIVIDVAKVDEIKEGVIIPGDGAAFYESVFELLDDFVSFSKDKALLGKESRHTLKVGDKVNARIIAVSFKDPTNPKIGMTMRQQGLGKPEWSIEEDEGKGKKKAEA